MVSIVDIELAASETGLSDVFDAIPALSCEMEQVISSRNRTLWFSGADLADLESALAASSTVDRYTQIGGGDDRWLFDIEFDPDTIDVFEIVRSENGTVLSGTADRGVWRLSVRFLEREAVSEFYKQLRSADITPTIVRLYDPMTERHAQYGLTSQQYQTLLAAIDRGYFEIPRKITMKELSDELGVSHQALSERLRRAYRALVVAEFELSASRTNPGSMSMI